MVQRSMSRPPPAAVSVDTFVAINLSTLLDANEDQKNKK